MGKTYQEAENEQYFRQELKGLFTNFIVQFQLFQFYFQYLVRCQTQTCLILKVQLLCMFLIVPHLKLLFFLFHFIHIPTHKRTLFPFFFQQILKGFRIFISLSRPFLQKLMFLIVLIAIVLIQYVGVSSLTHILM